MEKAIVHKLVDEVMEELHLINRDALESEGISKASVELAVRLSAITTVRILEKLELIEKG
ncbi:hypothetical protein [Paenibacillus senegalimassiliensis]|uniref:hypothetical protein n=1 Tax=Paenibacillus senegalimassiliensis TaxID=1737426 RepID=UPI00073EF2ED|nr:hypothetical protein [Paenibacillus senegalimassiliensis]